jgi:ribonuclease P protein component
VEDSCRGAFTFPPARRLRKRREFLHVQQRGRRLYGRRFIYYIQPGATAQTRLGITVSRKVGKAVVRNRIKRFVREVFRQHPDLFPRAVDVVVIAKRGIEDFAYATVRDEFIHVITGYFQRPGPPAPEGAKARNRRGRSRPGGPRSPDAGDV